MAYSTYLQIFKFCFGFGKHLGAEWADVGTREERLWNCGMKKTT